jgi:hypothetical protein
MAQDDPKDPREIGPKRHEVDEHDFDMVDFYASRNFAEIEVLMDVLEDHGIHCYTRQMDLPGMPVNVGNESEIRIVVQNNKLDEVRSLLKEAIAEGPAPDDGRWLLDEE